MEEYIDIKKYIENEKIFECTEVGEYNEEYYNIEKNENERSDRYGINRKLRNFK